MSKANLAAVYKSVLKNARARRLLVEIALADIEAMWDASGGRCALTGIPFDFAKRGRKRRPFAASVDRIDCSKGYARENCRLVCVAVNYAMSDWGEGVMRQIAYGLIGHVGHAPSGRLPGTYVRHDKGRLRFEVFLHTAGKRHYLGCFQDETDAHRHYMAAKAAVLRGEGIAAFLPRAHQIPSRSGAGILPDTTIAL